MLVLVMSFSCTPDANFVRSFSYTPDVSVNEFLLQSMTVIGLITVIELITVKEFLFPVLIIVMMF